MKLLVFVLLQILLAHVYSETETTNDVTTNHVTEQPKVDQSLRKALLKALYDLENEESDETSKITTTSTEISIISDATNTKSEESSTENEIITSKKPYIIIQRSESIQKPLTTFTLEKDALDPIKDAEQILTSASSSFNSNNKINLEARSLPSSSHNSLTSNEPSKNVFKTEATTIPSTTTTTAVTTTTEENQAKVEQLQFFPAPLVVAFTVHQDEQGLPKKVEQIFKVKPQPTTKSPNNQTEKPLLLPGNLQLKQKALEQEILQLRLQQQQQQEVLRQQQEIYLRQREEIRLRNNAQPFLPIINPFNPVLTEPTKTVLNQITLSTTTPLPSVSTTTSSSVSLQPSISFDPIIEAGKLPINGRILPNKEPSNFKNQLVQIPVHLQKFNALPLQQSNRFFRQETGTGNFVNNDFNTQNANNFNNINALSNLNINAANNFNSIINNNAANNLNLNNNVANLNNNAANFNSILNNNAVNSFNSNLNNNVANNFNSILNNNAANSFNSNLNNNANSFNSNLNNNAENNLNSNINNNVANSFKSNINNNAAINFNSNLNNIDFSKNINALGNKQVSVASFSSNNANKNINGFNNFNDVPSLTNTAVVRTAGFNKNLNAISSNHIPTVTTFENGFNKNVNSAFNQKNNGFIQKQTGLTDNSFNKNVKNFNSNGFDNQRGTIHSIFDGILTNDFNVKNFQNDFNKNTVVSNTNTGFNTQFNKPFSSVNNNFAIQQSLQPIQPFHENTFVRAPFNNGFNTNNIALTQSFNTLDNSALRQNNRPLRSNLESTVVSNNNFVNRPLNNNNQLNSLLYKSGAFGGPQSNEDLNIVSKVLSLNHLGVDYRGQQQGAFGFGGIQGKR